jgi:glycosyltransferase involved in cell wall biosynthesis
MARSANPTISIVIPARNEARNLEVVLPRLPDVAQIILVDGNSVDGTIEAAQRARPHWHSVMSRLCEGLVLMRLAGRHFV